MVDVQYVEMANVTRVPVNFLIMKGQGVKVQAQLYAAALACDPPYILPHIPIRGSGDVAFEGAHVFEPKRGYYETPIVTLDFASLYPSIMMAHNLCYSTHVLGGAEKAGLKDDDCIKTPHGDIFVKPEVRKGLLPKILNDLLTARKEAKKAMWAETDPFRKSVLDGRQLALKISANSGRHCAHKTSLFLGRASGANAKPCKYPPKTQLAQIKRPRVGYVCVDLNLLFLVLVTKGRTFHN